jgi:hypothetical protein
MALNKVAVWSGRIERAEQLALYRREAVAAEVETIAQTRGPRTLRDRLGRDTGVGMIDIAMPHREHGVGDVVFLRREMRIE